MEPMEVEETAISRAKALEESQPQESIKLYRDIVFSSVESVTEQEIKDRENAIYGIGNLMVKLGRVQDLVKLVKEIRPAFVHFPKAKTAKVVRTLIDLVHRLQGSQPTQILVDLCLDCIEWAKEQKRTFLKHRVETRLCSIYVELEKYEIGLKLLSTLLKEVKQLDDKLLLTEIFLIDTRANFECENLPKAKAALTAAKTNANAIHCPPLLQADIDLWSGVLALRENDSRTAFSYLYEAFEAFNVNKDENSFNAKDFTYNKALQALRCQLITKIMQDDPKQCKALVQSKNMLDYQMHDSVQAILKIAAAYEDRSLKKLEEVLVKHPVEDPVIKYHLQALYDTFVEKNILKIVEPYSRVEISHVAELIELPESKTLAKLSNMILDKKLHGTLDQGNGILMVYSEDEIRPTFSKIKGVIKNSSDCVDSLALLAQKIANNGEVAGA